MSNKKRRKLPPRAEAMIESLRGLGYDAATALADIVDNSISAKASNVEIHFEWNEGSPWIRVRDNGHGMKEEELESAMRLGNKNPSDKRSIHDLGRFGLGLKTASFSQARRLTVSSKKVNREASCLRWDLDLLAADNGSDWYVYEGPAPGAEKLVGDFLGENQGTDVLWENLDRMAPKGFTVQDFLNLIDRVELHLAMTFHRFLEAEGGLTILINGKRLQGWDPFLTGHPSKPWSPMELRLASSETISVQCHVLPHKDYLTKKELERAAGPAGWVLQEGFYIYRNRRLLVAGGWLGLGGGRPWVPDEAHRLARIRVDVSNQSDSEWKIDIRKSKASPPISIRPQLLKIATETRERARAVFAFRGQTQRMKSGSTVVEMWVAERNATGTQYKISRNHDVIRSLLTKAAQFEGDIERVLKLIEATVPVQRIWLDTAEDKETPRNSLGNRPSSELENVAHELYQAYQSKLGLTADQAKTRLNNTDPFHLYPKLIAEL